MIPDDRHGLIVKLDYVKVAQWLKCLKVLCENEKGVRLIEKVEKHLDDRIIEEGTPMDNKLLSARFWMAIFFSLSTCYGFVAGLLSGELFTGIVMLVVGFYFGKERKQ